MWQTAQEAQEARSRLVAEQGGQEWDGARAALDAFMHQLARVALSVLREFTRDLGLPRKSGGRHNQMAMLLRVRKDLETQLYPPSKSKEDEHGPHGPEN